MFKKIGIIAVSILITNAAIAQKPLKLSGKVTNTSTDSILILNGTTDIVEDYISKYVKINADGSFSTEIPTKTKINTIAIIDGRKQIAFLANSSVALKLNIDFAKQTPELSVIAPTTKSITSTQQIYYNSFGGYEAYTQKVAQIRANSAADFESQ